MIFTAPSAPVRRKRRGVTLVETTGALAIIAAALTLLTSTLAITAAQRRAMSHRQLAVQEAANALETLAAMPYDQLNKDAADSVQLSTAAARLPSGALQVTVEALEGAPEGKRISSIVTWNFAGQPQQAGLTVYRYQATRPSAAEEDNDAG